MAANDDPVSGADAQTPNVARIYDYLLGGANYFPADRAAAERLLAILPEIREVTLDNRAFLKRAVRYMVREAAVRQFLDLGAGLPTQANVHEVAREITPDARVVYVDHDPAVCAHARGLLAGTPGVGVVHADLRQPALVLADPAVRALIDFGEPVAVLAFASLHFIPDEDGPHEIMAAYTGRLAAGSCLAVTHAVTAEAPEDDRDRVADGFAEVYRRTPTGLHLRPVAEFRRFFDGFDIIEPGVVWLNDWRPDPGVPSVGPARSLRAAVGRKR